jgi:hypothetical protein
LLGWTFLLLAVVAVMMAMRGVTALGWEPTPGRKPLHLFMGGAALLVVAALAGVLRLLGARFFRG